MNKYLTMAKREFWEHKTAFITTPISLALLLILLLIGGITAFKIENTNGSSSSDIKFNLTYSLSETDDQGLAGEGADESSKLTDFFEDKRQSLDIGLYGIYLVFMLTAWLIILFYTLNTLYADRRDRSILFWKSIPVSETQTVLVKLAVALLAVPLFAILVSWVVQLFYALTVIIFTHLAGENPWQIITPNLHILQAFSAQVGLALSISVWYLPVFAWLLLASACAKRSPFLVATLPILVAVTIEAALFKTSYIIDVIYSYIAVANNYMASLTPDNNTFGIIPNVEEAASLLVGVLFAAAMITAAIWFRKNSFEI